VNPGSQPKRKNDAGDRFNIRSLVFGIIEIRKIEDNKFGVVFRKSRHHTDQISIPFRGIRRPRTEYRLSNGRIFARPPSDCSPGFCIDDTSRICKSSTCDTPLIDPETFVLWCGGTTEVGISILLPNKTIVDPGHSAVDVDEFLWLTDERSRWLSSVDMESYESTRYRPRDGSLAFIVGEERAKDIAGFKGGIETDIIFVDVPGIADVSNEGLGDIGIPSHILCFGVISREEAEAHGEIIVPHEMFPTLFQAIQRNTQRKKDKDDPILRDGALVNHAYSVRRKLGWNAPAKGARTQHSSIFLPSLV
jgi:hypothetical protein